jgi:putative flippase GtrA
MLHRVLLGLRADASFAAAISASYLMSRHFNFRHRAARRSPGHELTRFCGLHAVGNTANYKIFVTLLEGLQASCVRPEENAGVVSCWRFRRVA